MEEPLGGGTCVPRDEENAMTVGRTLTDLCKLDAAALVDERALAAALQVSPRTIRRMVQRAELPASIRLGGRAIWIAGKVVAFLAERADRAQQAGDREARRIQAMQFNHQSR